MNIPDLETFLQWTPEEIARTAPETLLYAPAGTRRRAALDGISREKYADWAMQELGNNVSQFFRLGVRNVVVPLLAPGQLREPVREYREHVVEWVAQQATSGALDQVANMFGYRLRLIGPATKSSNMLKDASSELINRSYDKQRPVLWMYVVQFDEEPWKEVLQTALSCGSDDREMIVRSLYGENIASITMYIGFGRFVVHPRIIPLILFNDDVQCYWTTKAGFRITETMVRRIFYDAVFSRARDNGDRVERYEHVEELSKYWERDVVFGIGRNMHGFWIPDMPS